MPVVNISLAPRIQRAVQAGLPVVALESTVITHGLPRPANLELARTLEDTIRAGGAEPATVGVIDGRIIIGLTPEETVRLADSPADKASLWNLAAIAAQGRSAGTTVAATLHLAQLAGIRVFATGGIGGVHDTPFDESTDLMALSRYQVITVCAGPKSILEVPATLERLESLGVPVIGYRSDFLAGFHLPLTDLPLPVRADSPEEIASIFSWHRDLELGGGLLVSNPVSEGLDPADLERWRHDSLAAAREQGIAGKATTPFLLQQLADRSESETVTVNVRLLTENAALAAAIASHLPPGAAQ